MKATATLAAVLVLSCASAAQAMPTVRVGAAAYGMPAPADAASRTIVLDDHARYANVNDGETVRFVHGDHSFAWTFNTVQRDGVAPLDKIAPQDFGVDGAKVYIAPNPLYNNS
ncbi:CzcE family metal-binding protein [Massilia sp. YIM B02763]|uniref:CzcE family metal-binding protein n=1 Tax=Massilia sp. YIM B02763 TaxID=3050130 RepID=UPI0025B67AA3|nr:CzcE family metal-binding protein [Massilia sp. YIM B02763]MDN4055091.1 CzcE family metal-binding protein [Massilia sp. YIM B02763]